MRSLIHELDNDALLILYLADELPAEDRAEVEQQLTTDGALRAELASARADAGAVGAALAGLDRIDPPTGGSASAESVALRRVGRQIRQWHAGKFVRPRVVADARPQPRFPAWAYPVAAAASVTIGLFGWWAWQRHAAATARRSPSGGMYAAGGGFYGRGDFGGRPSPFWGLPPPVRRMANMFAVDGHTGEGGGPTWDRLSGLAQAEEQARWLSRGNAGPFDDPVILQDAAPD